MSAPPERLILFLCTGNYYRSRFAEILFNARAIEKGLPWRAASRALALERGGNNKGPIAREALQLLEKLGVRDFFGTARMPQAVTDTDWGRCSRVIALDEREHRPLVAERHPAQLERVAYWQFEDVPGILPGVVTQVDALVAELLRAEPPPPPAPPVAVSAPAKSLTAPKGAVVKLGRETKGRRGKGVTLIWELPLKAEQIEELATRLKSRCGTGGTVRDGVIEIQGDQRDRIEAELIALGYRVKRAGG